MGGAKMLRPLLCLALAGCWVGSDEWATWEDQHGVLDSAEGDADVDADADTDVEPGDEDRDGWTIDEGDCDDADPDTHPGAAEVVADGIDQDCDGGDMCYADGDGDGYGTTDTVPSVDLGCEDPGESSLPNDCDDGDGTVHPSADENCEDGVDDDCDGRDANCRLAGTINLSEADARLQEEHVGDRAGGALSAGDVDGDGFDDILVGAYSESTNGPYSGAVYLVRGPVYGLSSLTDADAKLTGLESMDYTGISVAIGDVDGDGVADAVVGSLCQNETDSTYPGKISVFGGPIVGLMDLSAAASTVAGNGHDMLGSSLAAADIDGDGLGDLFVGAPGADPGGTYSGASLLLLGPLTGTVSPTDATLALAGEAAGDRAGSAIAVSDTNADGIADLVLGAFQKTADGEQSGACYVVIGPSSGAISLSDADVKLYGDVDTGWAGYAVAAGDVDGDGAGDILVGSPGGNSETPGRAYLIYGSAMESSALSGASAVFVGGEVADYAGRSVSIGDLDGDGRDDLLIGSVCDGASNGGSVYVVYEPGYGTTDLSNADVMIFGDTSHRGAGSSLAIGDIDADGIGDILTGAEPNYCGGMDLGGAYLLYGGAILSSD